MADDGGDNVRHTQVVSAATLATRNASGSGTIIYCGSFASGQLIVRVVSSAGVGAFLRPRWQTSPDRNAWADLVSIPTMGSAGVRVVVQPAAIGAWARCAWSQSATGLQWSADFVLTT